LIGFAWVPVITATIQLAELFIELDIMQLSPELIFPGRNGQCIMFERAAQLSDDSSYFIACVCYPGSA
jgi:hypothetical protein